VLHTHAHDNPLLGDIVYKHYRQYGFAYQLQGMNVWLCSTHKHTPTHTILRQQLKFS
jgi:hypothetical protein